MAKDAEDDKGWILRTGDDPKDAILMVINEAHEGEPNCTNNSKVSDYIMSANISLVELSHMAKTSINETGNVCLVL